LDAEQLRDLVASLYAETPEAVVLYDLQGQIVAANRAAEAMVGYTQAEVAGTSFREYVPEGDLDRISLAVRTALAGGTDHFESNAKHKDGTLVPIECYVFPATLGGATVGIFVQAHDISALRAAEASLNDNQERFRSLFEYHPDGIMELKSTGRISRVNVALESETGFYSEKLVGKDWTELIAPEKRQEANAALRSATRGEAAEHDSLLLNRLGDRIDVQLKLVPLHMHEEIRGAYAIFKNVTAQKDAERRIATQSERIRRLYLVAASRGGSIDQQIDATLRLGLDLFGFDAGIVTELQGDRVLARNSVGEGSPIPKGAIYPERMTLSRHLHGERSMLAIADIEHSDLRDDVARTIIPWRSFFAMQLTAGNAVYGSVIFASRVPRQAELSAGDRDLLQMMGLFIEAALERASYDAHIERLAFNDLLTGLPNRVLFEDRITHTIATARRYNRGFAVMYLDLDSFKSINDEYGHATGDKVLKAVAQRLRGALRESDTVARFGGDEFVILEPVVDGPSDSADLARKLHATLQEPVVVDGVPHDARASIGIALYPGDGTTIPALMEAADRALYRAKHEGRNRWCFADRESAEAGFKKRPAGGDGGR
jgi:diguanylate cyclase (GGDEF)-like protein/PAS domain S-box-containing protein